MKKHYLLPALLLALFLAIVMVNGALAVSELVGDADLNGTVNAADAAIILRYNVGLSVLSGQSLINADATCDGKVNAADAAAILRYTVHLENTLPPDSGTVTAPPTPVRTATPTPTASPTPKPTVNPSLGDVDENGTVNAADAACILRYSVKLQTLSDKALVNGDVNLDGKVNAADSACILRYTVKLDTLPPTPVTPKPATPTPSPTPTPVPTNSMGLPIAGDSGLVVSPNDPNYERISSYYLYKNLWTDESKRGSDSYNQVWGWLYGVTQASNNNKDIIGWCTMTFKGNQNLPKSGSYAPVLSTNYTYTIDEPIMYSAMNIYLDHSPYGTERDGGSLACYTDSASKNIVVTGHNSRGTRTHFHHLHSMQSGARFLATYNMLDSSDYIFNISVFGRSYWQVFAMYEIYNLAEPDSTLLYNTSLNCGGNVQNWIDYQLARSEVNFGVSVDTDDQFLTLYTCGDKYDSADDTDQCRLYIFLVCVDND